MTTVDVIIIVNYSGYIASSLAVGDSIFITEGKKGRKKGRKREKGGTKGMQ